MTSVAIIGAGGRMGHALVRSIGRTPGLKLVAAIEQAGHPAIGKDAGTAAGVNPVGVAISSDLHGVALADVIVDFTLPSATPGNVEAAVRAGKPLVIGTTGLGDKEKAILNEAAGKIAIVSAPNMSLGVNLLFAMAKKAATVLGLGYLVDIDETHHIHKKDAPSGTALRLGEKVAEGRGQDFKSVMVHQPETPGTEAGKVDRAARQGEKIVIHSSRIGEVVGDHLVSFACEGETIELAHHAWSRESFAMGALRAAQWVIGRQPGLYDMQDVLDLKGF